MTRFIDRVLALVCCTFALVGCVGTTGGDLVTFNAAAAGPADAVKGQDYTLPKRTGRGYEVTLHEAMLHVGAVYLNSAIPVSGAEDTVCVLNGLYVAEVSGGPDGGGLDVNVLDPTPQPFPGQGEGIAARAIVGEVWLMHGDVNATGDMTPVLTVSGKATRGGQTYPFQASITIDQNREPTVTNPATPGASPICKQRIASPILLANGVTQDIMPKNGGGLLLRIDPAGWFANVDFAQLTNGTFADASTDQPSTNLYLGLHARTGVYDFYWIDAANP
jgi:hypothetical protein